MIEAKVRKRLGQFQLDAEVKAEGITCVAGKNGTGKTSLLKALAGLFQVDEGYVRMNGVDVTRLPVERRGLVMVTPLTFFPHLDVDSHILWGARLNGKMPSNEEVSRAKSELGISFGGPVGRLSTGMRGRVALATALFASPRAILVDEVFSTVHGKGEFIAAFGRLVREAGKDLVFTSQDESDGRLAGQLYVLSDGSTSLRSQ